MKTCVSSYSFQPMLSSGELTQLQLIDKVKEMGFDGVVPVSGQTYSRKIDSQILATLSGIAQSCSKFSNDMRLLQSFKEIGQHILRRQYRDTIGAELLNRPLDEECERLFRQIDIAEILGASGMRHDATGGFNAPQSAYCGFDQALPTLIEGCRRVTEYAAEKGISTMVENHGYFAQDSDRVEKLVTGVANPNFGLLVDMGNFACADDHSDKAVGRVAKYAKHVHAKDFHIKSGSEPDPGRGFFRSRAGNYLRGAVIGHGNIPVAQCIGILKRAGYDKYVSIEFEGIEQTLTGIEIGLENLKRFIAEAE